MPFHHVLIGYLTFCLIKFVGYALAGGYLSSAYARTDLSGWKVGAVRTLIGMATGAVYVWVLFQPLSEVRAPTPMDDFYYLWLAPIRIAEWWLILWFFYDRRLEYKKRGWWYVIVGTLWSYLLDVPAVVGLIKTGDFPIC